MIKECIFKTNEEKKRKIRQFLKDNGDFLPEPALDKAEKLSDNFVLQCDDNNEIIAGATYEKNDWYLCTARYLATKESERGKRLGYNVSYELFNKMKEDDSCYVINADVSSDNIASIKLNEKFGMRKVNQFLWNPKDPKSETDVMQFVKFIPRKEK